MAQPNIQRLLAGRVGAVPESWQKVLDALGLEWWPAQTGGLKRDRREKTKARGNGEGTVWKGGEVYRWQVTLGYKTDGKRITRSGRAAKQESRP